MSQDTVHDIPAKTTFNILEFGAKGDGTSLNTSAIQAAVDACHAAGGGTVYCPPGRYITGSVELKSNVMLLIDAGAALLASKNLDDYVPVEAFALIKTLASQGESTSVPGALLYAVDAENIAIGGRGTIDGRGMSFCRPIEGEPWLPEWVPNWCEIPAYWYHYQPRPEMLIGFHNCRNVRIEDLTTRDSFAWNVCFFVCDSIFVRGVRVRSDFRIPNTDGINLVSSTNARISDCDIVCADDAICLKNLFVRHPESHDPERICRDITITNCTISTTCNAFKLGTDSQTGFENIVLSNCVIYNDTPERRTACALAGIALESADGGWLRGVTISKIVMENVRAPLFLRLGNRGRLQEVPTPGVLEDVVISDVVARNASICSTITGLPGHDVRGVSLSDIRIEMLGGGTADLAHYKPPERPAYYPESTMFGRLPAYGLYCRHVDGLTLRNVDIRYVKEDERPAVAMDDVKKLSIDHLSVPDTPGTQPELKLTNVQAAMIRGCLAPATKEFVRLTGPKTRNIALINNSWLRADQGVVIDEEVDADEVHLAANIERPSQRPLPKVTAKKHAVRRSGNGESETEAAKGGHQRVG